MLAITEAGKACYLPNQLACWRATTPIDNGQEEL